jgi:hypothetical protein
MKEALKYLQAGAIVPVDMETTILLVNALKEALAQPAQEPVAWLEPEWGDRICPEVGYEATMTEDHPKDLGWIPLVAQRPWVGLTNEDTFEIGERLGLADVAWIDLMKAIEAKLKEKNT